MNSGPPFSLLIVDLFSSNKSLSRSADSLLGGNYSRFEQPMETFNSFIAESITILNYYA